MCLLPLLHIYHQHCHEPTNPGYIHIEGVNVIAVQIESHVNGRE